VVAPYSKDTLTEVAVPNEARCPFRRAEALPTLVAAFVVTDGGVDEVVKVISEPLAVPSPTALARTW
jgi:hypothetical protein